MEDAITGEAGVGLVEVPTERFEVSGATTAATTWSDVTYIVIIDTGCELAQDLVLKDTRNVKLVRNTRMSIEENAHRRLTRGRKCSSRLPEIDVLSEVVRHWDGVVIVLCERLLFVRRDGNSHATR